MRHCSAWGVSHFLSEEHADFDVCQRLGCFFGETLKAHSKGRSPNFSSQHLALHILIEK